MIKSMTGFGRGEAAAETLKFTVEVKSVNHRYLDANVRIPKEYAFLETSVRSELKRYLERGKVDVFITAESQGEPEYRLKFNEPLARHYIEAGRVMAETFGLENDLTVARLAQMPEIFELEQETLDEDTVWSVLGKAVDEACEKLVATRVTEGEHLKEDLLKKLDEMKEGVSAVEERYPKIIEEYEARLKEKVKELLGDTEMDENRLATEVVLFSDRLCTDEETVRLKSHIETMRQELEKGGNVGRKLDFIAQEMNREANTILSKANDLATSNIAIDLKTGIEKIREQVQNIE